MTIAVTCPNGHRLDALDELAGCSLPCPACGAMVDVPPLESSAALSNQPAVGTPISKRASRVSRWISLPLRLGVRLGVGLVRVVVLTLLTLGILWFIFVRGGGQTEVFAKLKTIGLAFAAFHDTHRMFAFPRLQDLDVLEPHRRPQPTGLSWRVHLLPYLEQQGLYEQFHLDEPWDSPHNLTLVEHMPEVYRLKGDRGTSTRFRVLTGPGMFFGQETPPALNGVPDGSRNTILAVVVGRDQAVTWTQPDDLVLDPEDPLASLGKVSGGYLPALAVDGGPLMLPANIEASQFLALATPRGKEIIDGDTYRREYEDANRSLLPILLKQLVGE